METFKEVYKKIESENLIKIVYINRDDYQPNAISAAENELLSRGITENSDIVKSIIFDTAKEKNKKNTAHLNKNVKIILCQKCGENLQQDANFCSKCGAPAFKGVMPIRSNSKSNVATNDNNTIWNTILNPNIFFILYLVTAIPLFIIRKYHSGIASVSPIDELIPLWIGNFIGISLIPIIMLIIYNKKKDNHKIKTATYVVIAIWIFIFIFSTLQVLKE
jgi:hypothetical protein